MVKSCLNSLNLGFEERDASKFADFLFSKGFYHVPILGINGELFDVESMPQLENLLKEKGLIKNDKDSSDRTS